MSAQPALDSGKLRKNTFRLALAVGDNRHYVIGTIAPRHFVQTATANGIPTAMVEELSAELLANAGTAIDKTLTALRSDFPAALAESITDGLRTRLRQLEQIAMICSVISGSAKITASNLSNDNRVLDARNHIVDLAI